MLSKTFLVTVILFAFLALSNFRIVQGRYLPTRSNGDRIDKLRELLKDLLESELEKEEASNDVPRWHPENKLFYKRQVNMAEAPKFKNIPTQ